MKLCALAMAVVWRFGLVGLAHATAIESPVLVGAADRHAAVCTVGNLGASPAVVRVAIVDPAGRAVPSQSSCGDPIEPGFACSVVSRALRAGVPYSCAVVPEGERAGLRGTLMLLDESGLPVRFAELR